MKICPITGNVVALLTDYPDPAKSLDDKITKANLECGITCEYEPCPLVEQHNSIY
jgi:hypothetical protein